MIACLTKFHCPLLGVNVFIAGHASSKVGCFEMVNCFILNHIVEIEALFYECEPVDEQIVEYFIKIDG